MKTIDLRSDTLTKPTPEMYKAMGEADIGDEQAEEDPTVIKLQRMAAAKLGKEAALFVTSGTMGNLVSLLTHTRPGDSVILDAESHIFRTEAGGISAVAGAVPKGSREAWACPPLNKLKRLSSVKAVYSRPLRSSAWRTHTMQQEGPVFLFPE